MNIKPAKVKQETFNRICLLVLPTVLMTTAAIYHAANKPDVWSAYQGLIPRDEVNGEFSRLGRFETFNCSPAEPLFPRRVRGLGWL